MAVRKRNFGEYGYGQLPANINTYAPFFDGWHLITNWKALEPSAGVYDFTSLEADMQTLKTAGLNIGITMWINPKIYLPNWLFSAPFSVPVPMVNAGLNQVAYGYYLDSMGSFQNRLFLMLDALIDYLATSAAQPNIIYLQSAEGHESLTKAYIGIPTLIKYKISDAQFLQFQKDIWAHLYAKMQTVIPATGDSLSSISEFLDLVINAADSDSLTDYILTNLPTAWIRKSGEGLDYGYNLESFDFTRIDAENVITLTNPGAFRKRTDLNFTPTLNWFKNAYNMNLMQVALYMLTKGNDIWNFSDVGLINDLTTHATISDLVNELTGNHSPSGANKIAWWAANSKIDGSDTTRFPSATYGNVLTNGSNTSATEIDYVTKANLNRLRKIQKVYNPLLSTAVTACTLIDGQFGSNVNVDNRQDDKLNSDIGMKVRSAPLGKWITQPNYVTEAQPYWRVGNLSTDYWGRYAYGFPGTGVGKKMFFHLDADFKINLPAISVSVVYYDDGNCQWRLRNRTGSVAATVTNVNSKTYKTLTIDIDNFIGGNLTGGADLSLEYVAGNNTVKFVFIKINKKTVVNILPTVNAGASKTITQPDTTSNATATASDADGTIASYTWTQVGTTPSVATIATPNAATTNFTALSTVGDYIFQIEVTDNRGDKATDQMTVKVQASAPPVNPPISNAGADKTVTQPASSTSIGGADKAGTNPIASRLWTKASGPASFTIASPNAATTNINGLTSAGNYVFQKLVSDNAAPANTDTDTVRVNVVQAAVGIKYGVLVSDNLSTTQKMDVATNLGVNIIRIRSLMDDYTDYTNEKFLIAARNRQFKVALNCDMKAVGTLNGNKVPNPYPTGAALTRYLNNLTDILTHYKDIIEFVVIGNEGTNDQYYSGPIADYIAWVQAAIPIVHAQVLPDGSRLKVADSCVHVELVLGVIRGGGLSANEQQVKDIMDAYTNELAGLDYINMHGYAPPSTNMSNWAQAADYMRSKAAAGQKVISNEFGVQESNTTYVANLVNQVRISNFAYGIWYSGDGGAGNSTPLNVIGSTTLNPLGTVFSNNI